MITQVPTVPAQTTVGGFAVSIIGFIPVPSDNLKKQIEISTLLMDIQDGKKTAADLVPHMKQMEFRQQSVRKRVLKSEADEWKAQASLPLGGVDQSQQKKDEGGGQKPDETPDPAKQTAGRKRAEGKD